MKLSSAAKFTHRFGTAHRAGIDLVRFLQSEAQQGPPAQRTAMAKLAEGAASGHEIHELMKQQEPFFPELMVAMTAVGEEAGKLEKAMFVLTNHFQHQLDTRKNFIRSIAWPGIQLVAGIAVISLVIYLMGILTPAGGGQMADILGLGLRGGSGVLKLWAFVGMFVGAIGTVVWMFLRNIAGVQNLAPLLYMIPKLGASIQTITISKFCWTMAMSLEAGLDPIRSIRLALDSTGSDYYRAGADDAEKAIRGGSTLAGGIQATQVFPDDFIARVDISEHSGTDAEAMNYLAKEYDEQAQGAVRFMAGLATILIRILVAGFLIFFILRIASMYIGALNSALDGI